MIPTAGVRRRGAVPGIRRWYHNDIASWSGTEREIVANTIGALVRDGIVQRRNQTLMINDHAKLKMLASM